MSPGTARQVQQEQLIDGTHRRRGGHEAFDISDWKLKLTWAETGKSGCGGAREGSSEPSKDALS